MLAYHVLVYYINEYILVIFVSKLLALTFAVRLAGERLAEKPKPAQDKKVTERVKLLMYVADALVFYLYNEYVFACFI